MQQPLTCYSITVYQANLFHAMRTFLPLFLLLCVTLLLHNTVGAAGKSSLKPNIIVVLADDLGWSDLSCYGNTAIQTPHLDRLAAEGISFGSFYVTPICSPSRCALITGQYPPRWRITSFLYDRQMNEQRGMEHWLDPEAPTLARFLQNAGYATGHFGKWHLGGGLHDVDDAPLITEYGFDESFTNFCGLGPRVLPLLNLFDGSEPKSESHGSEKLGRGEFIWMDRNKITGCFVDKALAFIKKAETAGKPFYVNVFPDDPHSPFFPSVELRGDGSKKTLYHGVVVEMDRQLAPLFEYIRESKTLRDNTLILFLSDNGPEPGAGSSAPLRGSKGMLYDGGTRSPLIVWGEGLLAKNVRGRRNEATVFQAVDLIPSLLNIAGVEIPEEVVFDGEDFSAVILGNAATQEHKAPLFWRRPPDRPGTEDKPWPDLALREGNWKFLMQFDGSLPQLYDLSRDVSESKNLSAQHPELVEKYETMILDWNKQFPKDAGELR